MGGINIEILFKTMRLDEITRKVSVYRKEKGSKNGAMGYDSITRSWSGE